MIAGKRRGVGSRGSFCARCTGRLYARKRVIAGKRRRIAGTGLCTSVSRRFGGRGAADIVTLRSNGSNRRTRMRGDDPGAAQLRRVRGRRNGGMALIVVERQRRIFRGRLYVLRLLRCLRHVLLIGGGNLLWCGLRYCTPSAAIITYVGDVIDDDGLVIDVVDLHVRDVVDATIVEKSATTPIAAFVTITSVPVAIRYAAVVADFRAPIALAKGIDTVVPTPVSWRP